MSDPGLAAALVAELERTLAAARSIIRDQEARIERLRAGLSRVAEAAPFSGLAPAREIARRTLANDR